MRDIRLIAHDIRSTHNVGALLRTADGLGVNHIYFSGYTPFPKKRFDPRLPHLAKKIDAQIHKTALGAEKLVKWSVTEEIEELINSLKERDFEVIALEQASPAIQLPDYQPSDKVALLLGREVEGIDEGLLKLCDKAIEIPMFGKKESFNVVEAATMALYHCRFYSA